jgi:sec-independent protein translocase protein TatB
MIQNLKPESDAQQKQGRQTARDENLTAATALPTMILMILPGAVPQTISAASIGIPDTFFLMLLALIVFGPRRLPEIGRQIGKLMHEFRKVSNDFKFQMEEELRASEEADRVRKLQAVQTTQQPVLDVTTSEAAAPEVASLDIPPHPVLDSPEPLTITDGAVSAGSHLAGEVAPAVEGEVRAEATNTPAIQPPASGETIAAQKPFRHRVPEIAPEPVTESGSPATHEPSAPLAPSVVADQGRTGFEVQPGTEIQNGIEHSPTNHPAGTEVAEQELHRG